MEQIKRAIPNLITFGNLISGLFGIFMLFVKNEPNQRIEMACYCIFAAAIFDVFDGMVARLLNVSSEIGKQLDSLCDAISFGVLPVFILISYFAEITQFGSIEIIVPDFLAILIISTFLLAVGGVYRLARFNIDSEQSTDFKGMPIPAQAIATGCLALYLSQEMGAWALLKTTTIERNSWIILLHVLVFSFLMVSKLPLKSLKLKKGGIKAYTFHLVLIGAGILLFATLGYFGLYLAIIFYVIWSLLYNFTALKKLG